MTPFSLDPTVQRDLADFLKELRQQSARFVVVGGWAVMAHTGKPRPTKDLDIYVAPDDPNLARVARALGSFGAPANLCSLDALRPDQNAKFGGVTFGLPPNRIDVLSKMAPPLVSCDTCPRLPPAGGLATSRSCSNAPDSSHTGTSSSPR